MEQKVPNRSIKEMIHANTCLQAHDEILTGLQQIDIPASCCQYDVTSITQETQFYIDQSLIIQDIGQDQNQNMLFLRGPRWRKTQTLSFLATYYDCHQNKEKQRRDLFKNKRQNFKLRISDFVVKDKNFQRHPIIFLKFNAALKSSSEAKIYILKLIRQVYNANSNLYKKREYKQQLRKINQILADTTYDVLSSSFVIQCQSALNLISRLLQEEARKLKCYLMIDNVDQIVKNMILNGVEKNEWVLTSKFIDKLLSGFTKSQGSAGRRVFMTGVLNLFPQDHCFQFKAYDVFQQKYAQYFGLPLQQVKKLVQCKFHDKEKTELIMKNCEQWFGGYITYIGRENGEKKYRHFLQPSSTKSYVQNCLKLEKINIPSNYENHFEQNADVLFYLFQKSISQERFRFKLFQFIKLKRASIKPEDISVGFRFSNDPLKYDILDELDKRQEYFWLALLLSSFGNISGFFIPQQSFYDAFLPNRTIISIFFKQLRRLFTDECNYKDFSSLNIENTSSVRDGFMKAITNWKSILPSQNERNLNSICFLRYALSDNVTHLSFIEESCRTRTTYGIVDNIFYPRNEKEGSCGVIHQYKFTQSQNQQAKIIQSGFWQVFFRNYITWLLKKNNQQINKIAKTIIRVILLVVPGKGKPKLIVEDFCFSLDEAKSFAKFFESEVITKNILKQNLFNGNFKQAGDALLKFVKKRTIDEFVAEIKQHPENKIAAYIDSKIGTPTSKNFNFQQFLFVHQEFLPYFVGSTKMKKTLFQLSIQEIKQIGNFQEDEQQACKLFLKIKEIKVSEAFDPWYPWPPLGTALKKAKKEKEPIENTSKQTSEQQKE